MSFLCKERTKETPIKRHGLLTMPFLCGKNRGKRDASGRVLHRVVENYPGMTHFPPGVENPVEKKLCGKTYILRHFQRDC